MTYIIIEDGNRQVIQRENEDGSVTMIPINEANSDYQRYLRWLNGEEEGGIL